MSLTSVKMAEEVWLTCLTHALTTETEEIMGLLLGDIQYSNSGNATALIWGASPQMRSDRRKDRVETNPELLAAASAQAEISIHRMTLTTGRTTRVIGWYHSHPHITVLPSHVDVRTQAMYQLLEHGFIGLIFSCFSEDAQKVGKIQVIAFQSMDGKQRQAPPVTNSSIIEVESSWSSSDNTFLVSTPALAESFEQDTGDSRVSKASKEKAKWGLLGRERSMGHYRGKKQRKRDGVGMCCQEEAERERARVRQVRWGEARGGGGSSGRIALLKRSRVGGKSSDLGELFSYADVNYLGKQRMRENAGADSDSSDMTPSMQEALHRSNMDMRQPPGAYVTMTGSRLNLKHNMSWIIEQDLNLSEAEYGAEYIRKEVPLQVLPARYMLKLNSPLKSFTDMQHVLFEEERSAYKQAIFENMCNGKIHPLNFVHHTSTYQASLCKLMEYCLNPTISALQGRLKENEIRLNMLMEEAQSLEVEARGWKSGMHSESPRSHVARGFRGSPVGTRDLHASADSAVTRAPSGSASRRKAS
ncbi:hypothetical protein MUK42_15650 [Musa troglodytarum]|uniref:JAB1/MPN/MOV34 metalloenzyme domain-containing protein n=1 Tax=Musa troglodytarum TaxID=320322 RepID=A0A9E7KXG3_9LILI|nr:hypothetical protein MUK42_15650 [Musa troglodytarum]